MKKIILLCLVSILSLTGCGEPTLSDYDQTKLMVGSEVDNSKDMIGTSVEGIGLVTDIMDSTDEGQAFWVDTPVEDSDYNKQFISMPMRGYLTDESSFESFSTYEYIHFTGVIYGITDEDYGIANAPKFYVSSAEPVKEAEVESPTLKSIDDIDKQTEADISLTVNSVEFSPVETRVSVSVENDSNYELTMSQYDGQLLVDKKVIEEGSDYYNENYEDLPYEIPAGTTADGIITFINLDYDNIDELQFKIEGTVHNDDYEDIEFVFDII